MRRKWIYLFGSAMILFLFLTGCSKSTNEKTILTSTNSYYEPVKSIVGDKYKVEPIVKSVNVDPHSYKPTTDISKKVSKAALVVSNGLGYDDWVNKLAEANNKQDDVLNYGADVLHLKNGSNEHLWFDVDGMKKLSKIVYQRVSDMDNLNKKTYHKNYQKYDQKLDKLLAREKAIKQSAQGKKAYVTEPLPDYLLKDLGISVADNHFAKAIEDETDPSVKDIQEIQNGLKSHKVDVLAVNKQVSSGIVNKIKKTAKENDVPIVYLTETLPKDLGYYEWMDQNLDQIQKALE